MTDIISRADAIEAVAEHLFYSTRIESKLQAYDLADWEWYIGELLESLPSAEQVTSKLNNRDDSLLTDDSAECKEKQSKLDLISRVDAVNEIHKYFVEEINKTPYTKDEDGDDVYTDMPTVNSLLVCNKELAKRIKALPSASVEVVRCGECKNKYMKDFDMFCPHMVGIIKPNMHCSYGEKVKP